MANGSNANVTLAKIRNGTAYFQYDNTTYSAEIKAVQKVLYLYGYYPGGRDGYYGASTQAAVKGFQNEKDLTVNGNLNKATLAKLEAWSGTLYGTSTVTPTLSQVRNGLDYFHTGDAGSQVTTIRNKLISKGYTCASTGTYDSALVAVVKRFQSNVGLSADGLVGQGTLAVLEDTTSDTGWLTSSGTVNLTAGKLARAGFTNIMLRRDIVTKLNTALNTYGITSKMKVRQFLAQCMAETDMGRSLVEYLYKPGTTGSASYAPYYGAGMLHLTWKSNYTAYKEFKGNADAKIIDPSEYATQHVAIAYPADSAGWFWDKCANLNSVINWTSDAETVCSILTEKINGGTADASRRYGYYKTIAAVLK